MPTFSLTPIDELDFSCEEVPRFFGPDSHVKTQFEGRGETTYACDRCEETIIENIRRGELSKVGFECPGCGAELYLPDH